MSLTRTLDRVTTLRQHRVYPNPGSGKHWTDGLGRVWHRRGTAAQGIDPKRARTLLRRDGVPLVTWQAGEIEWIEGHQAKAAAAEALHALAAHADDVVAWEWVSDDRTHLLMLEHWC
jgi:hypothetical protein